MVSEERNALAELAEALAWFGGSATARKPTIKMFVILGKAHRIIAELANVEVVKDINLVCDPGQAVSAVEKCREIAEEGAK